MGLRCLIGHDFTEPEIERERKEEGSEVVTTVREVKSCTRCGETRIVSENTEVTTIEQLTDQAVTAEAADVEDGSATGSGPTAADASRDADGPPGADTATTEADPTAAGDASTGAATDSELSDERPMEDDAVILDDDPEPDESSADTPTDGASGRTVGGPGGADADHDGISGGAVEPNEADDGAISVDEETDTDGAPESDDGVILDDDESFTGGERERGAWPTDDEPVETRSEPAPWPEQHGEDEGYSAEIDDGDGDDAGAGVEFGGLTPEQSHPPKPTDPQTEYVEAPDDAIGSEGRAAGTGTDDAGSAGTEAAETVDDGDDGTSAGPGTGITRGESVDFERPSSSDPAEYYCPECGMTTDTGGSSMRAGDICPECKRGYVDERPR